MALQPGLVLIAVRPLLLLFTAGSMVCSVRMCVGEIKPTAGEIERHPNLRIAYIAQHAFHHLESHLMATPVQYIIRRYEHGEDEEEAEKVSDALPVLSLTTVTSLRLRLAHLMGWRVLITAGLQCCVCCMQTACTAQCTWLAVTHCCCFSVAGVLARIQGAAGRSCSTALFSFMACTYIN